jgi:2-isopropylmalate synthase
VDGTLFGNGERTGNADLVTLALNLYTQGVDPKLDFSRLNEIREVYERCTGMTVTARHPYAGEFVFTAFSGSHQDAINKGMRALKENGNRDKHWEVPYLPIDPKDIGREYEPIIRINSQSGKGGVAFIMEQSYGFRLPKSMHSEFADIVQSISEKTAQEVAPDTIWTAFSREYLEHAGPLVLDTYEIQGEGEADAQTVRLHAELENAGVRVVCEGEGNGPIDAFMHVLRTSGFPYTLVSFDEHTLEKGSDALVVAYVCLADSAGKQLYGVGMDTNIVTASFRAIVCAVNRFAKRAL